MKDTDKSLASYETARLIADAMLQKKGEDIVIMKMNDIAGFTDYFVICHGSVDMHVKAISDEIEDLLVEQNIKTWHREGYENSKWVLLDYVDVIAHVFTKESRDFYNIEYLWADAPKELIADE